MLQGVIALLRGGEREVTGRTLPTMSLCEYIKVHFHALLRQSVGEVLGQFNPQHLFEFTFFIIVLSGIFPTQSMVFWICFLFFFFILHSILAILSSTIYIYTEKFLLPQANC